MIHVSEGLCQHVEDGDLTFILIGNSHVLERVAFLGSCLFGTESGHLGNKIFLEGTHESLLLVAILEATVSELGGGIDEFERHLFQCRSAGVYQQRFA